METCVRDPVGRTETDRELATRLALGDAGAVDSFYRAHLDAVYRFVYFRVGRLREDAEDLTAETFMLALRKIGEFEGRASLATWLRGIARNKCRERSRMRARRGVVSRGAAVAPDLDALADLGAADLPERSLVSKEVAATVTAALSQLPQHYRSVLVSKYVDGMTFAEIAEQRGASAKAVESMVQRAKVAFARLLRVMSGRDAGESDVW